MVVGPFGFPRIASSQRFLFVYLAFCFPFPSFTCSLGCRARWAHSFAAVARTPR